MPAQAAPDLSGLGSPAMPKYAGNINATVGGITLNIDRDFVGGPLARLPKGSRGTVPEASLPNWFA